MRRLLGTASKQCEDSMQEQDIQRIRAAAWAAERPKSTLLEALGEVAEPLAKAEIDFGRLAQEGGPGNRGISSATDHTGQHMIVISMEDLAQLLEAVAKPLSFGEALIAIGFEPALGPQPSLRRGNPRIPLKRP